MRHSYQVFQNLSPKTNPTHQEGLSPFKYLHVALCATPDGPVDARHIDGLEQNYDTVAEFLSACQEAGYLAKESATQYDKDFNRIPLEHEISPNLASDDLDEPAKPEKPATNKKGSRKSGKK